jgi:hypothetical protein
MRVVIVEDVILTREGIARMLTDAGLGMIGRSATPPRSGQTP